jgi:sugar-specific transcriptional regulator TrmB
MDLLKTLESIGFKKPEAKVYLAALELGDAPAAAIAKKARIKRPSAYVLLKALTQKGYISSYIKRGVAYFSARDPKIVIDTAYEKAKVAKEALPDLAAVVPSGLKSKPRIQYFEGYDGLVSIMEDSLVVPNKKIYAWADVELAWNTLKDYYPSYIKKKNERNIFPVAIMVDNERARIFKEKASIEHRDVRLVPADKYPMSNEINIYDDKVSIISHRDMMGVIIQNREIADTQRSIFKMCWDTLAS